MRFEECYMVPGGGVCLTIDGTTYLVRAKAAHEGILSFADALGLDATARQALADGLVRAWKANKRENKEKGAGEATGSEKSPEAVSGVDEDAIEQIKRSVTDQDMLWTSAMLDAAAGRQVNHATIEAMVSLGFIKPVYLFGDGDNEIEIELRDIDWDGGSFVHPETGEEISTDRLYTNWVPDLDAIRQDGFVMIGDSHMVNRKGGIIQVADEDGDHVFSLPDNFTYEQLPDVIDLWGRAISKGRAKGRDDKELELEAALLPIARALGFRS